MILTQEQENIIRDFDTGADLRIQALAGTGKTSTLVELAKNYPHKRFLYLAYNAAMKKEAEYRMPGNVTTKTFHGSCWNVGKSFVSQLNRKKSRQEIINTLRISRKGETSASTLLHCSLDAITRFMHSGRRKVPILETDLETLTTLPTSQSQMIHIWERPESKKSLHLKKNHQNIRYLLSNDALKSLMKAEEVPRFMELEVKSVDGGEDAILSFYRRIIDIESLSVKIWDKMSDPNDFDVLAVHDTYLKLFHLQGLEYRGSDALLIDEAQDLNPVMKLILDRQKIQKVYVGDIYQQIYQFRGSVNELDSYTHTLSKTHRFGEAIANHANDILKERGSDVFLRTDLSSEEIAPLNKDLPYTILGKSNAYLIDILLDHLSLLKEGKSIPSICFSGNIMDILDFIRQGFCLKSGNLHQVKHPLLTPYKSWEEFCHFEGNTSDFDITGMIEFVDKRNEKDIDVLLKAPQSRNTHITMSTIHKAKGLEWDQVSLKDFPILDKEGNISAILANLKYVAVTRARRILEIRKNEDAS
jgi:DNA helicase IV